MKKTVWGLVVAAFAIGCCGCGGGKSEPPKPKDLGSAIQEGKSAAKEVQKEVEKTK